MVDWNANLEIFAALLVLGLSLVLVTVSAVSYARLRNDRVLFVGLGFLGLAAQGAFLTYQSLQTRGTQPWLLPTALMSLWIVALFYIAMRKP